MKVSFYFLCGILLPCCTGCSTNSDVTSLTIATVSNPDMRVMERFSAVFEERHPNLELSWVVLPENELRTRVTSDVAAGAGSFDIVTIGTYEAPMWAQNNWIASIDALMEAHPDHVQPDYDINDLLATVRMTLSPSGDLHALPFYGESIMTFYNKRMFAVAGLEMPERPTWNEIRDLACSLHQPDQGQYGIALRGLPGWGESITILSTMVNTHGGKWFDMDWKPQLTSPIWKTTTQFYVDLINECGQPGATGTGFTEALTLMAQGQAAIWVDATVAAGFLTDPQESHVAEDIGFAYPPVGPVPRGNHWLWAWSLAIPETSRHKPEALQFITWATSKTYIELVGQTDGWEKVPPGTRISTYERAEYTEAAPFAPLVLDVVQTADPTNPTLDPVPYVGIQYVGIPEFQGIGTDLSQYLADALAGNITVEQALERGQRMILAVMEDAGYYE